MSSYSAPLREIRFTLHDLLEVEPIFGRLGFDEAGRETVDAILEEAARFCEGVLAPLNGVGDEHGVAYDADSGSVTTAPGFKEAYRQFAEGGWGGLTAAAEHGGMGMPHALGLPLEEM